MENGTNSEIKIGDKIQTNYGELTVTTVSEEESRNGDVWSYGFAEDAEGFEYSWTNKSGKFYAGTL